MLSVRALFENRVLYGMVFLPRKGVSMKDTGDRKRPWGFFRWMEFFLSVVSFCFSVCYGYFFVIKVCSGAPTTIEWLVHEAVCMIYFFIGSSRVASCFYCDRRKTILGDF